MCFTDISTTTSEVQVSAGCAATIVILPVPRNKKVLASELLDKITDSIETELTTIALAMEKLLLITLLLVPVMTR